jgi:hypothetical protein
VRAKTVEIPAAHELGVDGLAVAGGGGATA